MVIKKIGVTFALAKQLKGGKYQSGQMGQTVNLLAYAFGGSNPSLPTKNIGALVQLVRMPACHAGGHGFESRTHRNIAEWSSW